MNYYNEIDPFAAQWLCNLIDAGLIPQGDVDERSIEDVKPSDLDGYTQHHFFCGIAGWPLALRLAGWPDDRPVWTGSCPCQPFSQAGSGGNESDPRHLWPDFYRLIEDRRPPIVFGEQVASADGRAWLAGVRADLDVLAYAVGASDLCAAGVGAPHIRQRLYWMAHASRAGFAGDADTCTDRACGEAETGEAQGGSVGAGDSSRVGVALGDTEQSGLEGFGKHGNGGDQPGRIAAEQAGPATPPVCDFEVVRCVEPTRQGGQVEKWRRVEPGTFPMAHGIPARVGCLRAFGNAIVPQLAAEFIRASVEAITNPKGGPR